MWWAPFLNSASNSSCVWLGQYFSQRRFWYFKKNSLWLSYFNWKDNLNSYNQLILNYSDLGINRDVEIIIEDNNNNIIQNESFVSYDWNNSYLTVTFHKQNLQ